MKTVSLRAALAASSWVLGACAIGCGSSNDTGTSGDDSGVHGDSSSPIDSGVTTDSSPSDSGTPTDSRADSSPTDAKSDVPADVVAETKTDATSETTSETSGEAGDATDATDAAPPVATGTKILSGGFHITSLTTDDYAVLANIDGTAGAQTIALGATTATSIDATSKLAFASGSVVFSWDQDGSTFPMNGNLVAWSASAGVHAISTTALAPSRSLFATFAASRDGSAILWLDNASTDGSMVDVKWAHVDGTAATTLFTSQAASDTTCPLVIAPASTGFVVVHCDRTGTTTGAAHLDAIDSTGVARSLSTDTQAAFTLDATGANVLHVTAASGLELITFAGTKTTIDAAGGLGLLSSVGDFAVYPTAVGALKKSATTSPAPTTVLSSGALFPLFATPTLGAVIYVKTSDATGFDLFLVDTTATTPAAITLDATQGDSSIFGDAFTADGTRAIYQTGLGSAPPTYDLKSTVVASGTTTAVASNVWDEHGYGAAKIAYGDNYVTGAGAASLGNADIHTVDLAATTLSPSTIATAAEVEIYVDSTKKKLVYAWNAVAASQGVYVAPLP
jgi:hypothetical protein